MTSGDIALPEWQHYTALISVHIPFSSLEDNRIDCKLTAQAIATQTKTHIECYKLWHLYKIRFCIFGKWRDCLLAGRLLWYRLIRKTTIYVHFDWNEELDKPLRDQNHQPFRHLYKTVEFEPINEFNLISISGVCWDVLKVRKELLKRKSFQSNDQQMIGNKREIIALKILKNLRNDINDDIHCPDSIYSIKNFQLLQLLTGTKGFTNNDQIETINCPYNVFKNLNNKRIQESNPSKVVPILAKEDNLDEIANKSSFNCSSNLSQTLNANQMKPKKYSLLRQSLKTTSKPSANDRTDRFNESTNVFELNSGNVSQIYDILKSSHSKSETIDNLIEDKEAVIWKNETKEVNSTQSPKEETQERKLIADRLNQLIQSQHKYVFDVTNGKNGKSSDRSGSIRTQTFTRKTFETNRTHIRFAFDSKFAFNSNK